MNHKTLIIKRAIHELENSYPPDDFISSYNDFLKHRDFLHFYQFNPNVFWSLIELIDKLWRSEKRINRYSLLSVSKRYLNKHPDKESILNQNSGLLFRLFQSLIIDKDIELSKPSFNKIKYPLNSMLLGVKLQDTEIEILCKNTHKSPIILNRVLRYPFPNKIISKWARENYETEFAVERRAEIASWLLDEDSEFTIDIETLKSDFEVLNRQEVENYAKYSEEMTFYKFIKKDFDPIFNDPNLCLFETNSAYYNIDLPQFTETERFYGSAINYKYVGEDGIEFTPELKLEELIEKFYASIDNILKVSIAWTIAYSRLPIDKKVELLKKHYSPDVLFTFFKIGKRIKSIEFLKWLL